MISRFFIDRPIFATVLSVVITLAGAVAVMHLPLAQFPRVSPAVVSVTCTYPGASAQTVSMAVAAPIEQQVNGVEGMMYMNSSCTNDGAYNLTVTFKNSIDLNMAQVLVQNRVSLAIPSLPDVIKQTGVTVRKRSPDPLLGFAIVSPNGRYDQLYLSNYTLRFIREELLRVPGVSDIFILAQRDFSMRIWVNPNRLAVRGLTAADLVQAIRDQNQQVATGIIGQEPVPTGQDYAITVDALGRLDEVEQFQNIIIRASDDGKLVRLKDVARVELRARNEDINCRFDGMPSAFVVLFQLPDANALELRERVMLKMQELSRSFPDGVASRISFDTTPYTAESISEVIKTLRDAIILVALVVLLFLQNWRSAIIPLAAVPVAIIGTFAVMAAFGFSLNNLTLFGLVLAIGIVVDDAIVVVEAVEHHIEQGLSPYMATIEAMKQVSGPVIAVGLVLSAVFIPCAFIAGITGMFFRQFALTIAAGTLISTLNSLTLSPALTALLLRPHEGKRAAPPLPRLAFLVLGGYLAWTFLVPIVSPPSPLVNESLHDLANRMMDRDAPLPETPPGAGWLVDWSIVLGGAFAMFLLSWPINGALRLFFRGFNRVFAWGAATYVRVIGMSLRAAVVVLLLYVGLIGLTLHRISVTPKGFIPSQDMGYLLVSVQLPDSASLERTAEVMEQLEEIALPRPDLPDRPGIPGVRHVTTIAGQSFALSASGSNFGSMFLNLHEFSDRDTPELYAETIVARLRTAGLKIPDAQISVFSPPPVRGIGRAGGFSFVVEDRGDLGPLELQKQVDELILKSRSFRMRYSDPAPVKLAELKVGESAVVTLTENRQSITDLTVGGKMSEGKSPLELNGFLAGIDAPNNTATISVTKSEGGKVTTEKLTFPLAPNAKISRVTATAPLTGLFTVYRANVPQLRVEPDVAQCLQRGVSASDFSDTLSVFEGSLYVNDFNKFGRTWQVVVQADASFRDQPEDVKRLKVRNALGGMVQLGTIAELKEVNGPLVINRYNMYPAAQITGFANLGTSSRDAIELMEELGKDELPASMAYEWTDMSYLELQAGNTAYLLFILAVTMVFLVLAAQYESWALPLAVILVVPMCLLSATLGVNIANLDINVFTQVGFVVLVGLASKNAILIVEYAKHLREQGVPRREATLEACKLRLRPIVMTSTSFILGVLPLVLAHGAGAEMRKALGVAVFAGMIGVTLFGLLLTPVFFATIDWLGGVTSPRHWSWQATVVQGWRSLVRLFAPPPEPSPIVATPTEVAPMEAGPTEAGPTDTGPTNEPTEGRGD
jgi:multidrug efflux pump